MVHEVTVLPEQGGQRLDAVLAGVLTDFSRNRIKELILAGAVAIGGAAEASPSRKVKPGDLLVLEAPPPEDATPQPQDIALDILFEDLHLLVINKPAGLVVHPAPGSPDGTLVNAVLFHCGDELPGINGVKRPGIVHRLDKDTSGVMVVAKTEQALSGLQAQFADHGRNGPLERIYRALCWERLESHRGTIDAPLGRDAQSRLRQSVRQDGRIAITHYVVDGRFGGEGWDISSVECRLETGRTHQIRVHLAHIGHPIVADPVYAAGYATKANRLPGDLQTLVRSFGRQALHAATLGFEHPATGETLRFEADLPPDMAEIVLELKKYRLGMAPKHA